MTEIPEHLLKRSKAARAKASGGGDDGDGGDGGDAASSAAPAASAPVPAKAAAVPAPVEEKPPPPPSPMVQAYNSRRKIPYWAMPVLAAIPLWAYVYQGTLAPPPEGPGPAVLGEEAYAANCASCHGGAGGGGTGPALSDGAVYETWPNWIDHFSWVRAGSAGWEGDTYGANNTPKGGGMPAFGTGALSDAEMLYVLVDERHELGGENPSDEDFEWLELAAEYAFENPDSTLAEILEAIQYEGPDPVQPIESE